MNDPTEHEIQRVISYLLDAIEARQGGPGVGIIQYSRRGGQAVIVLSSDAAVCAGLLIGLQEYVRLRGGRMTHSLSPDFVPATERDMN